MSKVEQKESGRNATIEVAKLFSSYLSTRQAAQELIQLIKKSRELEVIVDFRGVTMLTRSFAHEYVTGKKSIATKQIVEKNQTEFVQRMLEAIGMQPARREERKPEVRVFTCADVSASASAPVFCQPVK